MEKIQEIIYLPSLRCNLNCKHCGEIQDIKKEQEIDSTVILEKIEKSLLTENMTISISGGEPFLNNTLPEFIIEGLKRTQHKFSITSNGYFKKEIERAVESIKTEDRNRIEFHISIDGTEKTHNKIRRNIRSFQKAVETIKYLSKQKINVCINTVAQKENLHELAEIKDFFKSISDSIAVSFIPLVTDISENPQENLYTFAYQSALWGYAATEIDKKKILSKGTWGGVGHTCHAGMQNIVIGPDGKVYACVTGAFYKRSGRDKFCMGDLRDHSLDEILLNEEKRKDVLEKAVKTCDGCTNACEVAREVYLFGMKKQLDIKELPAAFELEQERKIGDALLDYDGWHGMEKREDGSAFCWSSNLESNVFVRNDGRKIRISYTKITSDLKVKIFIDGMESYFDTTDELQQNVTLDVVSENRYVQISFLTDSLKCPKQIFNSTDERYLGIALENINVYS